MNRIIYMDVTGFVDKEWRAEHGVSKVLEAMVTDPDVGFYICSATPMLECLPVSYVVEYQDEENVSEETRDKVSEETLTWEQEVAYVNARQARDPRFGYEWGAEVERDEEDDEDEFLHRARESA